MATRVRRFPRRSPRPHRSEPSCSRATIRTPQRPASSILLGAAALAATAGAATAADLQAFSGTWAYTAASCSKYMHDRIGNEARKRGAGLIIIRPAEIEWVTPATCEV